MKLIDSDEYPLSNVLAFDINPSFSLLSVLDELSLSIQIYNMENGKQLKSLYMDIIEEKKFVNIDELIYDYLKKYDIIQTLYLNHKFINDTNLIITASLPEIFLEDKNIHYFNKPVFLIKSLQTNTADTIISFLKHPDDLFILNHTDAQYIFQDSLIFIPVLKGWPTIGTKILTEETDEKENPFDEEFYNFTPQFAIYDFSGNYVKYFGDIDEHYKKLKLGYFANKPIILSDKNSYLVADQNSGIIKVYKSLHDSKYTDEISLIENRYINTSVDFKDQPLLYITQTFKENFHHRIIDLALMDSLIYAIISYGDSLFLISLNKHTLERNVNYIPKSFENIKFKNASIRLFKGKIIICSIYSSSNEFYYIEMVTNG